MKRIAFFVIILGFCPAADAAITDALIFTVNGQPQPAEVIIYPSQTLELGLELAAGHSIDGYTFDYKVSQVFEFITTNIEFPAVFEFPGGIVGTPEPQLIQISAANLFTPPVAGPVIFMQKLQLHCLGIGWEPTILQVIVSGATIVDGQQIAPYGTVISTLIIHAIPEPMTLMLLGLGSLFVVRRKK